MTAVTMPTTDGNLTEDDIQLILRLSALGLRLISEGAGAHKIATVFNDIRRVTSLRSSTSFAYAPQQTIPCSKCIEYLPNLVEYEACMNSCS